MKKKTTILLAVALCAIMAVGAGTAFAAWITGTQTRSGNTVTTESAVNVDLGTIAAATNTAVGPGESATFTFNITITDSDAYDLELTNLTGVTETETLLYNAWTVSVTGGTAKPLSNNLTLLEGAETGTDIVLTLTLALDAPIDWAEKTFSFSLELK